MTGHSSLEYAVEAIKHSAADYLPNPSENPDEVLAAVERELAVRRAPVNLWGDSTVASAAAA
jgi:ActR/RegA family two-component response regulator